MIDAYALPAQKGDGLCSIAHNLRSFTDFKG